MSRSRSHKDRITARLTERDGFLAAESDTADTPPLTADAVRDLVDRGRR